MALKKPPLVELWMSFRFEPPVGAPPWDRERYQLFLEVTPEHPNVEEMARRGVRVSQTRPGRLPKIKEIVDQVIAIRAFTEDGLRAVQMTPDQLVFNYLRSDTEPYPGFSVLLDEAMEHCRRYAECYCPVGVLDAAIHYVDLVEIPTLQNPLLALEDYFTLNVQFPEAVFGPFTSLNVRAVVKPPNGDERVEVVFATEPVGADDTRRRFRLE